MRNELDGVGVDGAGLVKGRMGTGCWEHPEVGGAVVGAAAINVVDNFTGGQRAGEDGFGNLAMEQLVVAANSIALSVQIAF